MRFGLRNAPATFSELVLKLLQGVEEFSGAYLDDIISFSDTWQVHATHLRAVLLRICSANLTLSAKKCQFAAAKLDYRGHHISLGHVQPQMKKDEALLAYPVPVNR